MSFPRYPAYKPSGVEWLGEVPEHWQEKPLKTITSINDEVLPESLSPDYEIEYVDIGSVSLANGIEKTEAMPFGDAPSRARRIPRDGDVLVSTVRTYLKAIAPVINPPLNLVASTGFAVVRPRHGLEPGFLKYALQEEHFIQQVISRSTGVSYPAINTSDVAKISLNLPGSSEQLAIVTFLDHETAKIDALIAEQQRLIELLQEKRQAVISHAVTKGLNPDAPMKDSGVEWLGEVPEHWSLARLKHAAKEKVAGPYGASLTKSMYTGAGYRVYGQQQVIPDNFEEGDYYIDRDKYEEMKRYSVSPGDVLISVMGTVGKVAVVPDFVEPGIINPRLVRYHLRDLLIPRFAQKLLLSTPFQEKILLEAKGATMDGLNMHILGDLPLPVPPRVEQEAILDQLHRSLASFDAMSSSVEESILLLKERRSALISAAVTGQIDVRGLVPEAVAA
jgi:type I restriction enzyme S subunit